MRLREHACIVNERARVVKESVERAKLILEEGLLSNSLVSYIACYFRLDGFLPRHNLPHRNLSVLQHLHP
jgi:hypothetical protein